jgi:hypothetical protein
MIGLVLLATIAASAVPADPPVLSPTDFAAYMQPKLPMPIHSGLVTAITAEGKTLVWHVRVDPGLVLDKLSDDQIAQVMARGWCTEPAGAAFFKAGYVLRWDITWRNRHRRIDMHNCR